MTAVTLRRDVPRSPYEKFGGIVFPPGSFDQARADLAGRSAST